MVTAIPVIRAVQTERRKDTAVEEKNQEVKMAVISMKQLLEAGVHFGHQTRRWNPRRK